MPCISKEYLDGTGQWSCGRMAEPGADGDGSLSGGEVLGGEKRGLEAVRDQPDPNHYATAL